MQNTNEGEELKVCRHCKWWGEEGDNPPMRGCNHVTATGDDGLDVHNGEPFNEGSACTGPDFGCIHHEIKDEHSPLYRRKLDEVYDKLMKEVSDG